jgi:hypothetical protein
MDLLEYQGKQLFRKRGVPVPDGRHAATVPEAVKAAEDLGYPVVIKAQVQIGGRGKAGGIKLANERAEAERHSEAILGMDTAASRSTSSTPSGPARSTRSTTRRSCSTARPRSQWRCYPAWEAWTWSR